jgi:hypothetical protein
MMSGGHFDYKQHEIEWIAREIERLIEVNNSTELNCYGDKIGYGFNAATMHHFQDAVIYLRKAAAYAQRIDWLVSGDDSEKSFNQRLVEELNKIDNDPWRT